MHDVIVRRERIVPMAIDVVWALVEPAEALPAWLPLAERVDLLGGAALGRRQRMHARWGRKAVEIDQEVTAYEPQRLLRWRHVDERIDGRPAPKFCREVTFSIALQSTGPATRIVLESRQTPAGRLAAIMLRLVSVRRIGGALDRALATLASAGR